jgi:type IV pilus assembly protein PilV
VRVHSPAGFTLIEVLVALFVLSVGLLGAAAMQAKARALHTDATMRSSALLIASSLAERMRANPVAMSLPDASNPYLRIDIDSGALATSPNSCFGDANCSPPDLAAFDAFETARELHDVFAHARLLVCRDAGSAPTAWRCDDATGAPVVIKLGWSGTPALALPVGGGGA